MNIEENLIHIFKKFNNYPDEKNRYILFYCIIFLWLYC